MEGDCNVHAHSSLWMRPTGERSINAKMVYRHGLACQQGISLVLAKTLPKGSCVFNVPKHHVSLNASVPKQNLRTWQTPHNDFGFLD